MKELLVAFLVKTLNITEVAAQKMLYKLDKDDKPTDELLPNAIDLLLDADKARVKKLKDDSEKGKEEFQNGYKKAKLEVLTDFEKAIKEQYGLKDSDKQGAELIAEVVKAKTKTTLTDDQVKAHPLYVSLEKEINNKVKAVNDEWEGKLTKLEEGYKVEKTLGNVKGKIVETLTGLKPILSKDGAKAKTQLETFTNYAINGYNFTQDDKGDIIVTDTAGKRIEDGHGNAISFDAFVKQRADSMFDYEVQDPKGGGGNGGGGAGGGGGTGVKVAKDRKEFDDLIFNAQTTEDRQALTKAFKESGNPEAKDIQI